MNRKRDYYGLSDPVKVTIDAEHWLSFVKDDGGHAMTVFRWIPQYEVRLACLTAMKDCGNFRGSSYLAMDWAEQTINDLATINDWDMAKRLLSLYANETLRHAECMIANNQHDRWTCTTFKACATEDYRTLLRVYDFVVTLGKDRQELRPAACKAVCDYIVFFSDDHHEAKSMIGRAGKFFNAALGTLKHLYSEADWHVALRILQVLIQIGSTYFLNKIGEIIKAHEDASVGPRPKTSPGGGDDFGVARNALEVAANLAVLRRAFELLSTNKA